MYNQQYVPNKVRTSTTLGVVNMAKRPGRKKRIGSIVVGGDAIRWFGGYCESCDAPHFFTRKQLDLLKIGFRKRTFKSRLISWLEDK